MLKESRVEPYESTKKLIEAKNVLQGALFIDALLNTIAIIYCYTTNATLQKLQDFPQPLIDDINTSQILLSLTLITMLLVGLALSSWLTSCYKYAKYSIGTSDFKYEGWTVLGWIIPVWSVFRPYQIINEIYKAGSQAHKGKDSWKKEPASGILLSWWVIYVFLHLVIIIISNLVTSDHNVEITPHYFELTFYFYIAICLLALTISGLWSVLIIKLTNRLLLRDASSKKNIEISSNNSNFALNTDYIKDSQSTELDNNDFLLALDEYEGDKRDKGLWAKCFAVSNGDEAITKSMYLKERAINFADSRRIKRSDSGN